MIAEERMKKNSEILYEIALKLSDDNTLLEHSLNNKSVYGMLMEDIEDADLEKLRNAVKTSLKAVDINIKASTELRLSSLVDYFNSIKDSLTKANGLVAKLDLADPAGAAAKIKGFFGKKMDTARALQAVIDLQNKVNTAVNTLGSAMSLITRNLEGKVEDTVKLADLDKEKHGVDAEQMKTGVSKAFKGAKPKGFMAKLGGLLGKSKIATIPGAESVGDFPVDKLADEILGLTFAELKSLTKESEKTAAAAEKAAIPVDAIKDVQAAAAEAPPPGKESEKSGEGEDAKGEDAKGEDVKGEDAPPENPESESDPAKEIKAIAAAAKAKPMSPKDAVSKALIDWEESLSTSSQKMLKAKNRNQSLKDSIFTGIDKGKTAVQRAVSKAVKDWRGEHEDTLVKSKRFAKKNFDSLQKMIPALAAQVLAQTKESRQRKITKTEIKKFVYKNLNNKFYSNNRLHETWKKNAGLLKD